MFMIERRILYAKCLTSETKRFFCEHASNLQIFKNHFGLHQQKANNYIIRNKLSQVPSDTIMKVVDFCEQRGFTQDELLKNPTIFRKSTITLDQYFSVMTEGGFTNITLQSLRKFRSLRAKKIYTLKEYHFIDSQTNVADNFIKHLNPCPQDFCVKTLNDMDSWSETHLRVLIEYFKWRLQVSEEAIANCIKVHPAVLQKSFKYLCANINFAEDLGYPHDKILKNGYILRAYPKYTQEILEKYPVIAGVPIRKAMRMYPKLISVSPSSIQEIYNTLKEYNISDKAIARHLNVFYLSPETVKFRLEDLQRVSEFKVLLTNPNVLKLIIHHNRAKSRLSFLKELQLKCSTVSLLGNVVDKFDSHIKEGRDVNSITDTYTFLRGIFTNIDDLDAILKEHPFCFQVPLTVMEDTYQYLINEKFTNISISRIIYILLYPKEKIKNALDQVKQCEISNRKKLTQVNKLNLALYFIEKEHHFTGDGVWTKSELNEEQVQSS